MAYLAVNNNIYIEFERGVLVRLLYVQVAGDDGAGYYTVLIFSSKWKYDLDPEQSHFSRTRTRLL